jgi:hypothetical protein
MMKLESFWNRHCRKDQADFAAVKMLKSIRYLSERGSLMASQDTVLSVLAGFNWVSAIAHSSPELQCGFIVPAFDFRWSTIGRRHV